jgi:Outer membrane protein beta-barrel domain
MKRIARVFGTVALGLAFSAAAARAQSPTPVTWNVGVGLSLPSPAGYNTGFNARVGATFPLTGQPVWIRPEATLDHFSRSCTGCGTLTIFGVGADAGYTFATSGKVGAYVLGGLRINHESFPAGSTTKMGVNLGGGITFPLAGKVGFLELRYEAAGGGFDLFPLTFGLRF